MQIITEIQNLIQNNLGAITATGVIGITAFTKIKEFPGKAYDFIRSRILYTIEIRQNTMIYDRIEDLLREKSASSRYTNFIIDGEQRNHYREEVYKALPDGRKRDALGNYWNVIDKLTIHNGTIIVKIGDCIYLASKSSEKRNVKNTDTFNRSITLTALTLSRKKALSAVTKYFDEMSLDNNHTILYKNHISGWNYVIRTHVRPINSVFYNDNILEKLIDRITTFNNSRELYEHLAIPYKLVICLEGPPGCGKTSLFLTMCSHFKKSAKFLNLQNVASDTALCDLMTNIDGYTLIDDIDVDAVDLSQRANVSKVEQNTLTPSDDEDDTSDHVLSTNANQQFAMSRKQIEGVTFKDVLQVFDGHFCPPGTIIFYNTNRFSTLDEAVTRPERTDEVIHVGYANRQTQVRMAKYYGVDWNGTEKLIQPAKLASALRKKPSAQELDQIFN